MEELRKQGIIELIKVKEDFEKDLEQILFGSNQNLTLEQKEIRENALSYARSKVDYESEFVSKFIGRISPAFN